MKVIFLVGLGGFFGAISRYVIGGWVHRFFDTTTFPMGTLIVNLLGCLFIGVCGGLVENKGMLGPELRVFLMLGLLGGFTTFSSFGYETFALMRDGEMIAAFLNTGVQVFVGLAAVYVGFLATQFL